MGFGQQPIELLWVQPIELCIIVCIGPAASAQQRAWKEIPHFKTRKYFFNRLIFIFLNSLGNLVSGARGTGRQRRWGDCTVSASDKCIHPRALGSTSPTWNSPRGSHTGCPESLQPLYKRRTKHLPSFFPWGDWAGFYATFYCQSPWVCKESYFCSAWIRLLSTSQGTLPSCSLQQKKTI